MKDRNEIIKDILDLFDTIDYITHDNKVMRSRIDRLCADRPDAKALSEMDERVMRTGREHIVKEVLSYWCDVKYERDEDTDEVTLETYDKWLGRVVRAERLPSWCSVDAFKDYFDVELRDRYEREREKSVAEAHGE